MLPPPPRKPVTKPLPTEDNCAYNKRIDNFSLLENSATQKRSNDNVLQSVQSIMEKCPTEPTQVLQDNNNAILRDIGISNAFITL